jgi:hypothetical protein
MAAAKKTYFANVSLDSASYLLIKYNDIVVVKWKIPCKHYVQDNTTGPNV